MKIQKNWLGLTVVIFLVAFLNFSCSNHQNSTRSEAETVVVKEKNFKKFVQYLSVGCDAIGLVKDPYIKDSFPIVAKKNTNFVHQIFYEGKDNILYCSFLNDKMPPKIILTIPKSPSPRPKGKGL